MSESDLFQPAKIGSLNIPNRFVRSATWEGLAAPDGGCTDELVGLMGELAAGGVGLIVSGHAYVRPEGFALRGQLGVDRDECIPGLARMAQAVHGKGGRIVLQLAHGGVLAGTQLTGLPAFAPSREGGPEKTRRREMTQGDIGETVRAYAEAALRAKKAGYDGVQVHAAHGYLLSQFLSPWFNRRSDRWGGTIENRTRIILEILASVRNAAGADCPVLVKLNSEDFTEGGLTREDSLQAAVMIASAGAASGGRSAHETGLGATKPVGRTAEPPFRVITGFRPSPQGPGQTYPGRSQTEVMIFFDRPAHEAIQFRILKNLPPGTAFRGKRVSGRYPRLQGAEARRDAYGQRTRRHHGRPQDHSRAGRRGEVPDRTGGRGLPYQHKSDQKTFSSQIFPEPVYGSTG